MTLLFTWSISFGIITKLIILYIQFDLQNTPFIGYDSRAHPDLMKRTLSHFYAKYLFTLFPDLVIKSIFANKMDMGIVGTLIEQAVFKLVNRDNLVMADIEKTCGVRKVINGNKSESNRIF